MKLHSISLLLVSSKMTVVVFDMVIFLSKRGVTNKVCSWQVSQLPMLCLESR